MYVIKSGKMICPECKQLSDYKVFDIPDCESFIICASCGKIQTEKTLMEAELEFQKQEILKRYKEMYPDGIIEYIKYTPDLKTNEFDNQIIKR